MAVSGMARLQGRQPAAIFYPLGHPMPYASENQQVILQGLSPKDCISARRAPTPAADHFFVHIRFSVVVLILFFSYFSSRAAHARVGPVTVRLII
jgi:hypothetical protein